MAGDDRGLFDRMADSIAAVVAHWAFFTACVLICVLWVPTLWLMDVNTSQLVISTITTIITFLLVALLHNDQHRYQNANNARMTAIMEHLSITDPVDDKGQQ